MHNHPQDQVQQRRGPSAQRIIEVQRQKLAELDDRHTAVCALADDYQADNHALNAVVAQVINENKVLRRRLGIGENDPIELTDEEAAALAPDAQTVELPDDATPADAADAIGAAGGEPTTD